MTAAEAREDELIKIVTAYGGRISPRELAHAKRMYRPRGAAQKALNQLVAVGLGAWEDSAGQGGPGTEFVLRDDFDEEDGNNFVGW